MNLIKILDGLLQSDQELRQTSSSGLMYPSEAGGCNRAVALRLQGEKGEPFSLYTLRLMNAGIAFEDVVGNSLRLFFGDNVSTQVAIKNGYYSGKLDFVVNHLTQNPVIVEHKAKGDKKWSDAELPEYSHVVQAALYLLMYEESYRVKPTVKLLYTTYNQRAEFDVFQDENGDVCVKGIKENVKWTFKTGGYVKTDEVVEKKFSDVIPKIMSQMDMFDRKEIPPVLEEKDRDGFCTYAKKPSCKFYRKCFEYG